MSSEVSLYETLGVSADADQEAIRKAYRENAKRYHPDTSGQHEDKEAREVFEKIQQAYETLSDEERRRKYDAMRKLLQKTEVEPQEYDFGTFTFPGSSSGQYIWRFTGQKMSGSAIAYQVFYSSSQINVAYSATVYPKAGGKSP